MVGFGRNRKCQNNEALPCVMVPLRCQNNEALPCLMVPLRCQKKQEWIPNAFQRSGWCMYMMAGGCFITHQSNTSVNHNECYHTGRTAAATYGDLMLPHRASNKNLSWGQASALSMQSESCFSSSLICPCCNSAHVGLW